MARLYGRALQGERLVDRVPHGHWKTLTFVAGLRYNGVTAPYLLDGPMDGAAFRAYVEQLLAPTIKRGDIVFMDGVRLHQVEGVEEAIEARGASVYKLPAYSPDFNPIEQLFAKVKSVMRKIAARTVPHIYKAIRYCLKQISKAECAAYVANSGYGQSHRRTL